MAKKDAEELVTDAAVEASEEVAQRVPGLDTEDTGRIVRSVLDDVKRVTTAQPLIALGAALCVGFLFSLLSR